MIAEATSIFDTAWWFMLFPGLALLFTVLAFNLVGDALQDALHPRTGEAELIATVMIEPKVPPMPARQYRRTVDRDRARRLRRLPRRLRRRRRRGGAGREFAPVTEPPEDAENGGTLEVIAADDVDYIDPGAQYYQFSYMISAGDAPRRSSPGPRTRPRSRSRTSPPSSPRSPRTG